jgi:hypothetical protein
LKCPLSSLLPAEDHLPDPVQPLRFLRGHCPSPQKCVTGDHPRIKDPEQQSAALATFQGRKIPTPPTPSISLAMQTF